VLADSAMMLKGKQRAKLALASVKKRLIRTGLGTEPFAAIIQTDDGSAYAVPIGDQNVARRLAQGSYQPDELQRLQDLVNSGSEVLIVGGHIGSLAFPLARTAAKVEIVEASPTNFRLLEINRLLSNTTTNVELHSLAANDTDGELRFLASTVNSGGSKRVPRSRDYIYYYDNPKVVTVAAKRLDGVFADRTFDLIVMDIEGSEIFAMRGMPELLRRASYLAIEFVPHHLANVAGVSVAEFLDPIGAAGFSKLHVPSTGQHVSWDQAAPLLSAMFEHDQEDDGLIFSRI
jgi:FkbM family methyltransferase